MVVLLAPPVDLVVRLVTHLLAVKSDRVRLIMPGLGLNHSVSKSHVTSVSHRRTDICLAQRVICTTQSVPIVARVASPSKAKSKLRSVFKISAL